MGHIIQNGSPDMQDLIAHHTHTPAAAAADVQQQESATYFCVVFLVCWLHILTVAISRRPAAGIRLSVV